MENEEIQVKEQIKNISLWESKWYLFKLQYRLASPKLNEKEEKEYLQWRGREIERGNVFENILGGRKNNLGNALENDKNLKRIMKKPTKRSYLIGVLKNRIVNLESQMKSLDDRIENLENEKYCIKHGHKEKDYLPKNVPEGGKEVIHHYCMRCQRLLYEETVSNGD